MKGFILAAAAAGFMLGAPEGGTPVSVVGAAGALHGTLLAPNDRPAAPAVLLIAGSGPTDRDGDSPLGVRAATLRRVAEGLDQRGVTTLRYDKRGVGASAGAGGDEAQLRIETFADDARIWAAELKQRTGAPCVWLFGHSEGGLIALLAGRDNPDVCGLVLAAAPGRRFTEVLREQLRANPANAPLLDQALGALSELEAGRTVDASGFHPAAAQLFRRSVQPFLISVARHDPAELVRAYDRPVLILQGDTDLQVPASDARRLAEAQPNARLVELRGVNHVLKTAPLDGAQNLATYADPHLALAPGVVETVAEFVGAGRQRPKVSGGEHEARRLTDRGTGR